MERLVLILSECVVNHIHFSKKPACLKRREKVITIVKIILNTHKYLYINTSSATIIIIII